MLICKYDPQEAKIFKKTAEDTWNAPEIFKKL